jgi:hypothetical protein
MPKDAHGMSVECKVLRVARILVRANRSGCALKHASAAKSGNCGSMGNQQAVRKAIQSHTRAATTTSSGMKPQTVEQPISALVEPL